MTMADKDNCLEEVKCREGNDFCGARWNLILSIAMNLHGVLFLKRRFDE